jgi:hypothetical protein
MPTPKKKIMGKGESAVSVGVRMIRAGKAEGYSAVRGTKKAGFKLKPKPNTKAEPTSNVKKRRSVGSLENLQERNKQESAHLMAAKSGVKARAKADLVKNLNKNLKKKSTVKITGK